MHGGVTSSAEELRELRASVRSAIGAGRPEDVPEVRHDWRASWPTLAGLGLVGFCVPVGLGGFGQEVAAAVVTARELGAELHGAPYAAAVATAAAVAAGVTDPDGRHLLAAILAGDLVPAIAVLGPAGAITPTGDGVRVEGCARLVLGAADADAFLVPAAGGAMALVRRSDCDPGEPYGFDVTRSCGEVGFPGSPGRPVAGSWSRVEELAGLLLAADSLGGVERMHARTTTYAAERTAFGRPIGGFQAVQHRLVDHAVTLRGLGLLLAQAGADLGAGAGRRALLARAGVHARAVPVLHDLLQLTGGVGFTWEHGLHLYERRAHLNARLLGGARGARSALAAVEGWTSGPAGP